MSSLSLRGDRLPLWLGLLLGVQIALLAIDFGKLGLTAAGGIDLGRWALIAPGQMLIGPLLLVFSPQLWRVLRTGPVLALVLWLAWNLTSVVWSVDPRQTVLQSLGAINLAIAGIWLVSRFGASTFYRLTYLAIAASTMVGVVYQLTVGLERDTPRLEGLAEGFNQMGLQCAVALIAVLAARRLGVRSRLDTLVAFFLLAALIASGARSALGAALIISGLLMLPSLNNPRIVLRAGGPLVIGFIALVVAVSNGLGGFGRGDDSALNGRELLWSYGWTLVEESPFRGHGMMTGLSLWTEAVVAGAVDFTAGSAHNIILEVLVGGGMIGLALFLAAVGLSIRSLFRYRRWDGLAMLGVVAVVGFAEALVARPSLTYWLLGGIVAIAATASAANGSGPVRSGRNGTLASEADPDPSSLDGPPRKRVLV